MTEVSPEALAAGATPEATSSAPSPPTWRAQAAAHRGLRVRDEDVAALRDQPVAIGADASIDLGEGALLRVRVSDPGGRLAAPREGSDETGSHPEPIYSKE